MQQPREYPRPIITRAEYTDRSHFWNDIVDDINEAIPDKDIRQRLGPVLFITYNDADYENALAGLKAIIQLHPKAWGIVWPYVEVCERVVGIPTHAEDLEKMRAYNRWAWAKGVLPGRVFSFFSKHPAYALCKYCARYTRFIPPNEGYAYLHFNNCKYCNRGYPMPSFYWDGVRGQAYIFYRRSVSEPAFYQDFVRRFEVQEFNDDEYGGTSAPGLPRNG